MEVESFPQNTGPGEVIAEANQGFRGLVARGEMTAAEAIKRSNKVCRELMILWVANPGIPFETGSTQVDALIKEGRWLRRLLLL
mgnify:FL=1